MSGEELLAAYKPDGSNGSAAIKGYPLLRQFNRDLPGQGINYFDLTGIFVDRPETLYIDDCCHLNPRGYELLAAAMVRRMEPALSRWGQENPAKPVSALAAGRRPAEANSNSLPPPRRLSWCPCRIMAKGCGMSGGPAPRRIWQPSSFCT